MFFVRGSVRIILIITLSVFLTVPAPSRQQDSVARDSVAHPELSGHERLVRGERLFRGLVYLDNKELKCSACHTTMAPETYDTINWNPDAMEISLKYLDRSAEDLGRVLMSPVGERMAVAHANFNFSPGEVEMLKGYMDSFTEKGLTTHKPVISNLLIFIIASLLFLFALTDLVVTKKIRKVWIHLGILSVTTIYITWVLVVNAVKIGRSPGYSPDQPVKFSHAVHAGQNGTDCIYCHSYAPYSKVSGIPSGSVCMNCHLLVRNGQRSGMFEIAKVIEGYENGEPIRWIQVHNLPDHVYYNHAQHVNAGGVDCSVCHGKVEEMHRIVQVSDLSMGFCVDCHRSRKVNFTGNDFYSQYRLLAEKVRNGGLDSVVVESQGGNDCMRCHY